MKRRDHEKEIQELEAWIEVFLGSIYQLKKTKAMIKVTISPIIENSMLVGVKKTAKLFGLTVKTKTLLYPKAQDLEVAYHYNFI